MLGPESSSEGLVSMGGEVEGEAVVGGLLLMEGVANSRIEA